MDPLPTFESGGEAPDARLEVEEEHEGDRDREGGAVHAADVDLNVICKCFILGAMYINQVSMLKNFLCDPSIQAGAKEVSPAV